MHRYMHTMADTGERDYTKLNCTGDRRIKSVNKFSTQVGFEPAIPNCEDRHASILSSVTAI